MSLEIKLRAVLRAGRAAHYRDTGTVGDCPYQVGSALWRVWMQGYGEAGARRLALLESARRGGFIGAWARMPRKNGRGYWWVQVLEERGAFVRVGKNRSAGRSWWTSIHSATEIRRARREKP